MLLDATATALGRLRMVLLPGQEGGYTWQHLTIYLGLEEMSRSFTLSCRVGSAVIVREHPARWGLTSGSVVVLQSVPISGAAFLALSLRSLSTQWVYTTRKGSRPREWYHLRHHHVRSLRHSLASPSQRGCQLSALLHPLSSGPRAKPRQELLKWWM